jgi:hypothetical protein
LQTKDCLASGLEPEGVLELGGEAGFLDAEIEAAAFVEFLDPALAEDEEEVVAGGDGPADAALEAEVAGAVVELEEIAEGEQGGNGVVDSGAEDAGDEVALGEPGEGLIGIEADGEPWRELIAEASGDGIGGAGPEVADGEAEAALKFALLGGGGEEANGGEAVVAGGEEDAG